jgi:8-oxo-dGTP pyrophosphatase MutT (NUDIX family)
MARSVALSRPGQAKRTTGTQFAALPYRITDDGLEILVITSRRTRRWIVPKGWPMEDMGPAQSAAREAWEEAGVSGEIQTTPLGHYHYVKEMRKVSLPCRVDVFALRVTRQHRQFAEKDARELKWVSPLEAAAMVDEPGLRRLILRATAKLVAQAHNSKG